MAIITDTRPTPTIPDAVALEPTTGLGGFLWWVAAAVALAAAAVLAIQVFDTDTPAVSTPWYSVEHGSITALDHAVSSSPASASVTEVFTEQGSIAALDHAASSPAPVSVSEVFAEHGSIAALDHAASSPAPVSSTEPFTERGSITAIDHAAETERG